MTEFYDIYHEAGHRTREDIEAEIYEIQWILKYSELRSSEIQYYEARMWKLKRMLEIKEIYKRDREYKEAKDE